MDKIGSAILDSEESDYYNKLRSFVIKLSDKSIKQAQALTDQFRNQSFHANLIKMIRYFRENLLNEYNRKEHTKLKTQYKILQNQLKQLNSQKDPNLQTIQDNVQKTLNFIKVNSMQEAYELSQKYDITYIKDLLSQVRQYRWLKSYTFSNSQILTELQFTSLKGQQLKTFVKNKVDVLKQVNEFFLTEIDNIKNSRPPQSQLPSHIFSQQARKLHEQLLAHFRQIRTQIKNRQQDLRGTIKSFMRQLELDIDEKQNDEATFLQEFLQKLRKRLLKKRQAVLFERQKQKNENLLIKSCRSQILSQNKDIMMNSFMKPKRDTLKMLKRPSLEQNKIIIPIDEIKNIINQYKEKLSLVPIKFKEIKCSTAYEELKYVCGNISKALNYYKDQTADLEQKLNSQREEADQQRKKYSTKDRELIMQGNNNQWNIIQSIKGQQYAEYQNRINQLNQLVKQLRNQNENFQQQLKLNKLQLQFKQLQLSNLKTQKFNISNLSTAAISIQQHVQNIQYTDINQLQKLLKQKDNELQSLKRYYTSQKNRLKQKHEQKLASEKIRYRKLAQEIDELNDKIDKINNMYLQRLEYDISKTPQPRRVQARQLAIQTDNQNLVTSISFQKKESRNQHQLSQDTNHNDSFSFQSINLFDSTKRINLSQLNDERESFQSKIRTLQFKVDIYESHIQRLQTFYDSVIMKKDVELNHLREIAQTLKKDKNQLTIKLHKSQIKQITHNEINLHNLHLFPAGGIFQYYNYQQRLFLIQRLTARLGKIQLTRLIYRTDNYNKTNFHRYVDGYRNIVVIIKTVLGKLIAGYSEQAFNSKGIVPGYGMILSLWKKKAYELRDKRAITYDDYYLIFGNSEIRLRSLEFKLFSNFGISNSFYDSRGDKVHELLGEGNERDVNITGFEVYALELED